LWEIGKLSNQQIASLVGLTYSNIRRRDGLFKAILDNEKCLAKEYGRIKSQIKV